MSKQIRANHPIYNLLPTEIEGFHSLAELALDMRWSWNHSTDEVWRELDPQLWEITHNPWVILQAISRDQQKGFVDYRHNPTYTGFAVWCLIFSEKLIVKANKARIKWFQALNGPILGIIDRAVKHVTISWRLFKSYGYFNLVW